MESQSTIFPLFYKRAGTLCQVEWDVGVSCVSVLVEVICPTLGGVSGDCGEVRPGTSPVQHQSSSSVIKHFSSPARDDSSPL